MAEFVYWPADLLPARAISPNPVPFTRGSRSLGGSSRRSRTDLGYWRIDYSVMLHSTAQRRTWNAIRTELSGSAGLLVLPVFSWDTAPYPGAFRESATLLPHSDDTLFLDGSPYETSAIAIETVGDTPIGATSIRLRAIDAAADLSGIRFSYEHALYETGAAEAISGSIWTLRIFPSVRKAIPDGASVEVDLPTCLVRLSDDRGMDVAMDPSAISEHTVSFEEAADYWNALAVAD